MQEQKGRADPLCIHRTDKPQKLNNETVQTSGFEAIALCLIQLYTKVTLLINKSSKHPRPKDVALVPPPLLL